MNDKYFSMGIMLMFITLGVNTMITLGSQLQDTQGTELKVYLISYTVPGMEQTVRDKVASCSTNANQLTPQATTPGSTEGFTPITCKDSGGIDIAGGIAFLTTGVTMLAGLELVLLAIGTYMFPMLYALFLGIATIVAFIKWTVIAYAASQIVRALFGRSLF